MTGLSTHVLDAVSGVPATGMTVILYNDDGESCGVGTTDDDGRIGQLNTDALSPGTYRICFDTGNWFKANNIEGFYPRIDITFSITDADRHYHVPVLLSPFAYSTYRGS